MKNIKITITILFITFCNFIFSSAPQELFKQFNYNRIFVETGSYHGHGISAALNNKFDEIHSIEISPVIETSALSLQ